jgi:uncharacterized Zn-finger protein
MSTTAAPRKETVVELVARDLNGNGGIFCPAPKAGMKIWNNHPRVFLDIATSGAAKCPYCGTVYKLKDGEHIGGGGH